MHPIDPSPGRLSRCSSAHLTDRTRLPLGTLVAVSGWRALTVTFALIGFSTVPNGGGFGGGHGVSNFAYLTQQGSFLTAMVYAVLLAYPLLTRGRRHEPRTPWLRGALAVVMALISITFMTMLGGSLHDTADQFEHLLTPTVVVLDWLLVGRAPVAARWWFPISWLALPLGYLIFYVCYVGGGTPLYPFLRPGHANFFLVVFGFLVGVLGLGYLLFGLARLVGALRGYPGLAPLPDTAVRSG